MQMLRQAALAFAFAGASLQANASDGASPAFTMIALGTAGRIDEDNFSAYLLAPKGSSDFVALDAGTLVVDLREAIAMGSLAGLEPSADARGENPIEQVTSELSGRNDLGVRFVFPRQGQRIDF